VAAATFLDYAESTTQQPPSQQVSAPITI